MPYVSNSHIDQSKNKTVVQRSVARFCTRDTYSELLQNLDLETLKVTNDKKFNQGMPQATDQPHGTVRKRHIQSQLHDSKMALQEKQLTLSFSVR